MDAFVIVSGDRNGQPDFRWVSGPSSGAEARGYIPSIRRRNPGKVHHGYRVVTIIHPRPKG